MDGALPTRFSSDDRSVLRDSPTLSRTPVSTPGRIDVIERIRSRRDWPDEEKLRIVAAAFAPGARVAAVAKRFEMSPSQIYTWRQLIRDGVLGAPKNHALAFAEVEIAHNAEAVPGHGAMEIRLANGVRIAVDATVDRDALVRVLWALQR